MLEIYQGALPTQRLYKKFEDQARKHNYGASCIFVGLVRKEDDIDGLSFDIYQPLLETWFQEWCIRLQKKEVILCMAHSCGDVFIGESSFMCALLSSQRKNALEVFDEFVEDFKHRAPIWKFDLKNSKRVFAASRSHPLPSSGILA